MGPGVGCWSALIWEPAGRPEQSAGRTGCGRAPGGGMWSLAGCPDGGRRQLALTDGHASGTAALIDDRRG